MEFTPIALAGLSPFAITMIVIAVVLIAALIFLYFFGKKQQKKMDENQKEIDAAAQQITMLVIDLAPYQSRPAADGYRCYTKVRTSGKGSCC